MDTIVNRNVLDFCMGIVFRAIDMTVGLRITHNEEMRGIDIGEHGIEAYAGFQVFSTM